MEDIINSFKYFNRLKKANFCQILVHIFISLLQVNNEIWKENRQKQIKPQHDKTNKMTAPSKDSDQTG